jgi:hypothetical protein
MAGKKGMHDHHKFTAGYMETLRRKINSTKLTQYLQDHALGKREMSPTQITAAQTLLRKVLPDLTGVEHSGSVGTFTTLLNSLPAGVQAPGSTQEQVKVPDAMPASATIQ